MLSDNQKITLTLTRKRAKELGLLVCTCGHPENNHFSHGTQPCACCDCQKYVETSRRGITYQVSRSERRK